MGRAGQLPWHLPADLKHFRSLTIDKSVIMGRKTYESVGKPLPRRRNIVLTRDFSFGADGVEIANSIQDVFEMTSREPEIAVIGGADIFDAFAPYVNTAYVTRVEADVDGDVYYNAPERPATCDMLGEHAADDRNAYAMTFLRFDYT
jgi:dihydrofolate reductase